MFNAMVRRIARDLSRPIPELEDMGLHELLRERQNQVQTAHDAARLACSKDALMHGHVCEACGMEWMHCDLNWMALIEAFDIDFFDDAHKCPRCGQEQFLKAWDDDYDDDD